MNLIMRNLHGSPLLRKLEATRTNWISLLPWRSILSSISRFWNLPTLILFLANAILTHLQLKLTMNSNTRLTKYWTLVNHIAKSNILSTELVTFNPLQKLQHFIHTLRILLLNFTHSIPPRFVIRSRRNLDPIGRLPIINLFLPFTSLIKCFIF